MTTAMKINCIICFLFFYIGCKDSKQLSDELTFNLKGSWKYIDDRENEISFLESNITFSYDDFIIENGLFSMRERKYIGNKFKFSLKSDSLFIRNNYLKDSLVGVIHTNNDTLYIKNENNKFSFIKENRKSYKNLYKMNFVQLLYYNIDSNLFYFFNGHKEITVLSYNEKTNFYNYYNATINDDYFNFLINRLSISDYYKENNKVLPFDKYTSIFYYQGSNLFSNKEEKVVDKLFSDIIFNIHDKKNDTIITFYEPNSHFKINDFNIDRAFSLYILSSVLKNKINSVNFINTYNIGIGFYPLTLNELRRGANLSEQDIINLSLIEFNKIQGVTSIASDGKNFCIELKNKQKIYASLSFDILKIILENLAFTSIK
ncbi:hypothetical protein [Empedobacter brevis]|uniref:hypothetical protein n=1 Tax=Empedobacter brevis TaxID=247 RepID=UPI0028D4F448|nr:hypothetical protein [Empedobacter brevis]